MSMPDDFSGLLQAAVLQSFNAVVITDASLDDGGPYIVFCNPAFCSMSGYLADELVGLSPRVLQGQDTDPDVIARLRDCLLSGTFFHGDAVNYRKDGTPYHVEWNISPVRNEAGEITHYVSVQRDITASMALQQSRDMLAAAIHATPDAVVITDAQTRILFVNHAFERMSGYVLDEVQGRVPAMLYPEGEGLLQPADLARHMQAGEVIRRTVVHCRKGGERYFADQSVAALTDDQGEIAYYVSVSRDVSDRIETENKLREWAHHDALTGLFNRRYGERLLGAQQGRAQAGDGPCSVILCDIDHFKQINDNHGHHCGDEILRQVTARLAAGMRGTDRIVRWGGDELLVLLPHTALAEATTLAERVRAKVAGMTFPPVGAVTLSLGVAEWCAGESRRNVLKRADEALYQAKERGRNRVESSRV